MKTPQSLSALSLLLLLAGTCPVAAGDQKPDVQKLLARVTHFTDDDLRFRTAGGVSVFVDPVSWPTDDAVIKSGMVKPDVILITHPHDDHFQPTIIREYLRLNPQAILAGPADVVKVAAEKGMKATEVKPGQNYTLGGIQFGTVPAYFVQGDSHPQARQWVGYNLQLDGANYYVTGDTECLPEMAAQKVDVLFPLLTGCGGRTDLAVKMAELTKAPVVVPAHTGGIEETIKGFITRLPKGTRSAFYREGQLVVSP